MIHLFALCTVLMAAVSGLYTLYKGKSAWRNMRLKYAGIVISSTAALWFLVLFTVYHDISTCKFDAIRCLTGDIYHIARNTAIIIFHACIYRDTVRLQGKERRGQHDRAG